MYEVEYTDEFDSWWNDLDERQQEDLDARVRHLMERGPETKRPVVGEIKGSDFEPRMKELICNSGGGYLRVLFMFDPRGVAILLIGGDKTGDWSAWYRRAVPEADRLYREHLAELERDEH